MFDDTTQLNKELVSKLPPDVQKVIEIFGAVLEAYAHGDAGIGLASARNKDTGHREVAIMAKLNGEDVVFVVGKLILPDEKNSYEVVPWDGTGDGAAEHMN